MKVKVLYFAASREAVGIASEDVEFTGTATTASLLQLLLGRHPQLAAVMGTSVFAVNQEYVDPNASVDLKDNDEVAIIPPLSGG